MVTLTAWVLSSGTVGMLKHTYVTADNGHRWGCFGPNLGGVPLFEVKDADFECAMRASEQNGNAGIEYSRSGMAHQIANRILLAGTPPDRVARSVDDGSAMFQTSKFLFGRYGYGASVWARRHGIESKLDAATKITASTVDDGKGLQDAETGAFGLDVLVDGAKHKTLPPFQASSLIIPDNRLIIPERRVAEGILIRDSSLAWTEMTTALMRDWNLAYQISADKWEELIAGAFKKANYDEVILTPRSGDFGRDLIATKNGVGSVKINVSIKAYKPSNRLSYRDVRELAFVLLADSGACKGIITTTSDFPPRIGQDKYLAPLLPHRLELMNGNKLREWIHTLAKAT